MKIDFQITKPFLYSPNNILPHSTAVSQVTSNFTELPNIYYVPFGNSRIDSKLQSLSGVHCPCCGVVMTNNAELNKLYKQAEKVQTPQEFFNFLNDNKQHIQPDLIPTITLLSKKYQENPNLNMDELIKIAKEDTIENLKNILKDNCKYVDNILETQNLTDKDKKYLTQYKKEVVNIDFDNTKKTLWKTYDDIMQNTIYSLEIPQSKDFYYRMHAPFMRENIKKANLSTPIKKDKSAACFIIRNIFRGSPIKIVNINNNKDFDKDYNKIMLCNQCSRGKKRVIKQIALADNEEQFKLYKQHIHDICSKLDSGMLYPMLFHNHMKAISKNKLDLKGTALNKILQRSIFEKNQKIDFDLIDVDGIPCACCGQETITHDTKLKLYSEIESAKDKFEILDILKRNEHIIRKRYKPIIQEYSNILKQHPDISDEEVLNRLQFFMKQKIKGALLNCIASAKFECRTGQYTTKEEIKLQHLIKDIENKYLDTSYDRIFDYESYKETVTELFQDFNKHKKGLLTTKFKHKVKDKLPAQYTVNPLQSTINKYDSPLKVVAQDIIKQSVATKDHLVAKKLDGSDEKNNMVVLCKSCNQYKGSAPVSTWSMRNENIEDNFQKYVDFIKDKIINQDIDISYIQYLKSLQQKTFEESKGRINIVIDPDLFMI